MTLPQPPPPSDVLACPFCGHAPEVTKQGRPLAQCGNRECFIFLQCTTLEEWQTRAPVSQGSGGVDMYALSEGACCEYDRAFRDQPDHAEWTKGHGSLSRTGPMRAAVEYVLRTLPTLDARVTAAPATPAGAGRVEAGEWIERAAKQIGGHVFNRTGYRLRTVDFSDIITEEIGGQQ